MFKKKGTFGGCLCSQLGVLLSGWGGGVLALFGPRCAGVLLAIYGSFFRAVRNRACWVHYMRLSAYQRLTATPQEANCRSARGEGRAWGGAVAGVGGGVG